MANTTRKIICVRCPRGCEIITTLDGYSITSIEGNVCKLGNDYAQNEISDPKRIVTTTVKVLNGEFPLVPVWTTTPIAKDKIMELMQLLKNMELTAPVKSGQIVLENIFNLSVNVETSGEVL